MIEAHKELSEFVTKALEKGRDFGKVPGSEKECLMKAGGERVLMGFQCYADYEIIEKEVAHDRETRYEVVKWRKGTKPDRATEDRMKAEGIGRNRQFSGKWEWQERETEVGTSLGLYRYVVKCNIRRRDTQEVVGSAVGSCCTLEAKYIRQPRDAENTVLKMAQKRAMVAAVLNTFGLSDRFTQDIEDQGHAGDDHEEHPQAKSENAGNGRASANGAAAKPPKEESQELKQCKAWGFSADQMLTIKKAAELMGDKALWKPAVAMIATHMVNGWKPADTPELVEAIAVYIATKDLPALDAEFVEQPKANQQEEVISYFTALKMDGPQRAEFIGICEGKGLNYYVVALEARNKGVGVFGALKAFATQYNPGAAA